MAPLDRPTGDQAVDDVMLSPGLDQLDDGSDRYRRNRGR